MRHTDDWMDAPSGPHFPLGIIAGLLLAALLALGGCASNGDPKPAGVMLDPVWHTEVHDVTVDSE